MSTAANEQAGQWCVRLTSETFTPAEQAEFDRWLGADPANTQAFHRALAVWQGLHTLGRSPEVISLRAAALESLRRANERQWSRQSLSKWRWPAALAAGVALLLVGTMLFYKTPRYETDIGERRAVLLKDGSRLSLDAATRVAVDYSQDRRTLELLAGRAKFDVVRDASRPFAVKAGTKTITAIGTAFSVELLRGQVHVVLYEGRVAVTDAGETERNVNAAKILDPGSELIADLTQSTAQVEPVDMSRSLAWESGQLNFVQEPLQSAVDRLNRYSNDTILVADESTARIPIDGVFNAGDSAAFIEAVSSAFPIQVRHESGQTVLGKK